MRRTEVLMFGMFSRLFVVVLVGACALLSSLVVTPVVLANDVPRITSMTTTAGTGRVRRLLYQNLADSSTVTNPQTYTAFDTTYSLPASSVVNPKAVFIVEATGVFTTGGTASPGWSIALTAGSQVLQTTSNSVAQNLTNEPWFFRATFSPRNVGASGTLTGEACQLFTNAAGGTVPSAGITVTNGTPSINWTVANTIGLSALSANSDGSNAITIRQLRVYIEE